MHSLSSFCFRMNLVGFMKQKGCGTGLGTIVDGWERQALFTGLWLHLFLKVPSLSLWESSDMWAEKPALKLELVRKYEAWHFEPIISAARINFREDVSWEVDSPYLLSVSQEVFILLIWRCHQLYSACWFNDSFLALREVRRWVPCFIHIQIISYISNSEILKCENIIYKMEANNIFDGRTAKVPQTVEVLLPLIFPAWYCICSGR